MVSCPPLVQALNSAACDSRLTVTVSQGPGGSGFSCDATSQAAVASSRLKPLPRRLSSSGVAGPAGMAVSPTPPYTPWHGRAVACPIGQRPRDDRQDLRRPEDSLNGPPDPPQRQTSPHRHPRPRPRLRRPAADIALRRSRLSRPRPRHGPVQGGHAQHRSVLPKCWSK